jgi:cytochrome P450
VSEREPGKYAEMRRYLSSAFSDRSLKSQEPLIAESVDRLVDKSRFYDCGNFLDAYMKDEVYAS